jgi:hypothetical protein
MWPCRGGSATTHHLSPTLRADRPPPASRHPRVLRHPSLSLSWPVDEARVHFATLSSPPHFASHASAPHHAATALGNDHHASSHPRPANEPYLVAVEPVLHPRRDSTTPMRPKSTSLSPASIVVCYLAPDSFGRSPAPPTLPQASSRWRALPITLPAATTHGATPLRRPH